MSKRMKGGDTRNTLFEGSGDRGAALVATTHIQTHGRARMGGRFGGVAVHEGRPVGTMVKVAGIMWR